MFLRPDSLELDNYTIYTEWKLSLDHASLTVNIAIIEEHIQTKKHTLVKNSKKEENFIAELIKAITRLNTENISSKEILEQVIQTFANDIDKIWFKHSKVINITKYPKIWNENCHRKLEKHMTSKQIKDWKSFKSTIRKTKCTFFDQKIQEILNKNSSLWELMN